MGQTDDRRYPEPLVREWFVKWLASRRSLKELVIEGAPKAAVLSRLFHKYMSVEFEDAIEARASRAYQIGRAFEYRCRDALRAKGYVVFRSPQSRSPADLVALRKGVVMLVQCKTRRDMLGRKERLELIELAESAGAKAVLAWRGRWGTGIQWEDMDGSSFLLD